MTSINITTQVNTVEIIEESTSLISVITPGPQGAAQPGVPTFIQPTQPTTQQLSGATKYAWWDTSNGALTLWIEDGAA